MTEWITVALLIATYIALVAIIVRICSRHPIMAEHQTLLFAISVIWALAATFNLSFWTDESNPYDGTAHEREARIISDQLSDGRFERTRVFLGNELYRVILGHFYYVTRIDGWFIYGFNGLCGFTGMMLSVLAVAKGLQATSIPRWFILLGMCLPSLLLWCPLNLKEGGIMLCLGIILYSFSDLPLTLKQSSRSIPFGVACLYLFLIRPHIAAAWIGGMSLGRLRQKKSGIRAFLAAGVFFVCSIGAVYAVELTKPGFLGSISEEGISGSMQSNYEARKHMGDTAMYDQTDPKPFLTGLLIILFSPPPQFWSQPVWLLMGMESIALTLTLFFGITFSGQQLKSKLRTPFCFGAIYVMLLMAFYLSYSYNMGLAIRQRMQVIPAMLVLIGAPLLPLSRRTNSTLSSKL